MQENHNDDGKKLQNNISININNNSSNTNSRGYHKVTSNKNNVILLLLCLFMGAIGVHRLYVGRFTSGIAMLIIGIITLSTVYFSFIIAIWAFIDLIIILCGSFKDSNGYTVKW